MEHPIVGQLAAMGIALVAPIRGISTRGRDNEFIVALQEWAEPLRAEGKPGGKRMDIGLQVIGRFLD